MPLQELRASRSVPARQQHVDPFRLAQQTLRFVAQLANLLRHFWPRFLVTLFRSAFILLLLREVYP